MSGPRTSRRAGQGSAQHRSPVWKDPAPGPTPTEASIWHRSAQHHSSKASPPAPGPPPGCPRSRRSRGGAAAFPLCHPLARLPPHGPPLAGALMLHAAAPGWPALGRNPSPCCGCLPALCGTRACAGTAHTVPAARPCAAPLRRSGTAGAWATSSGLQGQGMAFMAASWEHWHTYSGA